MNASIFDRSIDRSVFHLVHNLKFENNDTLATAIAALEATSKLFKMTTNILFETTEGNFTAELFTEKMPITW